MCSQALSPSSNVSLFDDVSKAAATVPKIEVQCSTERNPILLAPRPTPRHISCAPWHAAHAHAPHALPTAAVAAAAAAIAAAAAAAAAACCAVLTGVRVGPAHRHAPLHHLL